MKSTEYLQTSAAARELHVSEQWVRSLADTGKVKVVRTAAGARLYDANDLRELAAERKRRDAKRT